MKKSFRKFLSILLVLIMVASVIPLSVFAASTTHSHPVCGNRCTCASDTHYSSNWIAWDGTTKLYNGDYYLTKDIVLDSTIVLDYSYSTRLCLNGHSITCEDTVFDIYSYRSLLITDCMGTGKIESTNSGQTISNNNLLSIWGGTILNSSKGYNGVAIMSRSDTVTYVCGGRVESSNGSAIYYQLPGADIGILGGTVHGNYSTISGDLSGNENYGSVEISGGRVSSEQYYVALDLMHPNFTMTGGYVEGDIYADGTITLSGGTIDGSLVSWDGNGTISVTGPINMTGGYESEWILSGNTTVSAGTYHKDCRIGPNTTISAGNFTDCPNVYMLGTTWLYGGYFNDVWVEGDKPFYLSGVPDIDTLHVGYRGVVSAQNPDGTGSYGGDVIEVQLYDYYSGIPWKDGDVVIKNVTSDAVAQKFVLAGEDSRWMYLERSGNNLVLRILPHGTWGSNVTWGIKDGVLTVSGTGALDYTHSGNYYPWGKYTDKITKIVVEPGITKIPAYAFEYCENAETIILPETLTTLSLNAFNDCGSLNNLMIPSSVLFIEGTSNSLSPAFLRCESLTDMYYLGTAEEWNLINNGKNILSASSTMTKHFFQYHETTATCTEGGTQAYYQFDNTSVYDGYYDEDKKPITQLKSVPELGHRVIVQEEKQVDPIIIDNSDYTSFVFKDGAYYSTNSESQSRAELKLLAVHPCTVELEVSKKNDLYGLFWFRKNGSSVNPSYYQNIYSMTLNLERGDCFEIVYERSDSKNISNEGISVKFVYDKATITIDEFVSADSVEADCTNGVVCNFCQNVVKQPLGHRIIGKQEIQADPIIVENNGSVPFTLTNGTYYSNNKSNSSSSELTIKAEYDCELTLNYGVSSEQNYDKLLIYHNNTNKVTTSGSVSNRTLTLTLSAGDTVTVCYSKDGSVNSGQDRGWVSLIYDQVMVADKIDIPVDTIEHECSDELVCDYCKMEVQGIVTHQMGEWITETEATCIENGSEYKICNNCDYSETQVIDAVGHSHIPSVTDPTCTAQGYTTYTCECGDTYVGDYFLAKGHRWSNWETTVEVTADTDGEQTRKCTACGTTETRIIYRTSIIITVTDANGDVIKKEIINEDITEISFNDLADGEYTLKVEKADYVTREYTVTSIENEAYCEMKLHRIGDINGDGKISVLDYTSVLKYVKKTSSLDGYAFDCADVNGDGKITILDYTKLLKHVKKTELLW